MKNLLLAMAVFGAFAGAASAQTNVTIYGVADIAVAHENNGINTVTRLDSGLQSGSRIGFKGTEDLGSGLSALFQLENGFALDTGAMGSALFNRQAFVGLSGGFGTVKFGRQYTPMHIALDTIDPLDAGLTGGGAGIESLFSSGHGPNTEPRTNNTINYSLSSGPFSGQLAYTLGETPGSTSASREWGFAGSYVNGPLTGVLAYHNANNAAGSDSTKTTMLGGVYNLGPASLHAAYAWNKGAGTLDTRDAMIGVTVPVGAGSVIAEYQRKNDRALSNANAAQWALAYTHTLSKRTNLYTSYSRNTNDSGASYNAGGNGLTDTLLNVGIRHTF